MTRRLIVVVGLVAVLVFPLLVAANGGAVHEVQIKDYSFHPPEITIKAGDTVRWVNKEKRQYHSVWFESLGEEEADYFFPDEGIERTFDKPGSYKYRCGPHEEMRGVVHVK
jgi:plastocyanin